MSLRVKNSTIQVSSPAASIFVSGVGGGHSELVGTGTPPLAIPSGRAFVDT